MMFPFRAFTLLVLGFFWLTVKSQVIQVSKGLEIRKLSENAYVHISYIKLENGASFPCNGLIYVNDSSGIVFDTPINKETSNELLNWIKDSLKVKIKAVVVNHFHVDCLGGLEVFHANRIPSYGQKNCLLLAKDAKATVPKFGFERSLTLDLNGKTVKCSFFGEAHSKDNIVAWLPEDQIMYGGCMIKSVGAGKGNLADANTSEWANTVKKVKKAYPNVKTVIPGHGEPGDMELLDYTIHLFEK